MLEYVFLLGATTGTQWFQRAVSLADDPVVLWGGGGALVLLLVWVLRPKG